MAKNQQGYGQDRKDLTNMRFNRLKVISFAFSKKRHTYWKCKCDCGKEVIIDAGNLKNNHTKSCGCYQREVINKRIKNIKGKKFGYLIVINESGRDKYRNVLWKCKCKCGKIAIIKGGSLRKKATRSCGCFSIACAKKRKGIKHPNWRHDWTIEQRLQSKNRRHNPENNIWRKKIFKRDNYICQITYQQGQICAHHIFNWELYPQKRFDVDNGITMLKTIHQLFHNIYGYKNNTISQLNEFKKYIKEIYE